MFDSPAGSFSSRFDGGVPVEGLLDRLAGEVEADPRAVGLGLAAGVVVDLEITSAPLGSDRPMPSGSRLGSLPGAQPPRSPWISTPGPEKHA